MLGAVQERILQCFKDGRGTAYAGYPCFHDYMQEDSAQTVVACLFEAILPLDPGLTDRLAAGIDVLDAGCGAGRALAERFPASRFVGYDLSEDAIAAATQKARETGLDNVRFAARDLSDFDERNAYDLICSSDAVHDQRDPQRLLTSLYRALRPDGVYLMQDIGGSASLEKNLDFPLATFMYGISCMHCTPVSLGQDGWGWARCRSRDRDAAACQGRLSAG